MCCVQVLHQSGGLWTSVDLMLVPIATNAITRSEAVSSALGPRQICEMWWEGVK